MRFTFEVKRDGEKYAYTKDRLNKYAQYFVCDNCEVMILDDTSDYENIYTDGSYYSVDGDPAEFLQKRFDQVISFPKEKSDNMARVERIKAFLKTQPFFQSKKERSVMDVGAGMGVFLYKFLEEGWKGTAVDLEPNSCAFMRKALKGVDVLEGRLQDFPRKKKYDLITFNRVLEHISDQFPVLRAAHDFLADDGILYLELPDALSYYLPGVGPTCQEFGWSHYFVYSAKSMVELGSKAGFEMVSMTRLVEPSAKHTIYAFYRKKIENV